MRSPQEMKIIQIEITNACPHKCSNCSRFCGHHRKPFFMDFDTFKRAVDSLDDFENIVGIMGGEPTIHPQFAQFTDYIRQRHGMKEDFNYSRRPVLDYMKHIREREAVSCVVNRYSGPGLWSCMPANYYHQYENIMDTYIFQCLNDHMNVSYHQPTLVSRQDLNIPDDEWFKLRDSCWIQNFWSASITPKGAFFCEVAAALDMLLDGPGGWPIEPGWWKRQPEDFGDQLHWCELCGAALDTSRRNANEEVDDISKTLLEKLDALGSPKVKRGKVSLYTGKREEDKDFEDYAVDQYLDDYNQRFAAVNHNLFPQSLNGVLYVTKNDMEDVSEQYIDLLLSQLDEVVIIADTLDIVEQLKQKTNNRATVVNVENEGFGRNLNVALSNFSKTQWIVLLSPNTILSDQFARRLKKVIINPGVYYNYCFAAQEERHLADKKNADKGACLAIFSPFASALRKVGYDGIFMCKTIEEFKNLWVDNNDKLFNLSDNFDQEFITDEQYNKDMIDRSFMNDTEFKNRVSEKLKVSVKDGAELIVLQSAVFYVTRGIIKVLSDLGYKVHLFAHERFKGHFEDIVDGGRMHLFNNTTNFDYEKMKDFCEEVRKENAGIAGAVVPYSTEYRYITTKDKYGSVEKVAECLGGEIVAKINLKRNFVEFCKDIG